MGLSPAIPVKAAGWRIEPPVSVPSAPGTSPAATAAAEPPEEPPGVRRPPAPAEAPEASAFSPRRRQGLTTGP